MHGSWPKANGRWWRAKIEANRRRDLAITAELISSGWAVVRIWEHEDPVAAVNGIAAVVAGC